MTVPPGRFTLVRMKQEKDAWKNKCHTLELSYQEDWKEKDDLIEILKSRAVEMKEKQEDLFSPGSSPCQSATSFLEQ